MAETSFSRKLDASGRIMIPVKLREQMGLVAGKEYYFEIRRIDGRNYICIDCGSADKLQEAINIVEQAGLKISET